MRNIGNDAENGRDPSLLTHMLIKKDIVIPSLTPNIYIFVSTRRIRVFF